MIFSLPNMQKWLENKYTNCLNYEHTIFLSEAIIQFLLNSHKFKITKKQYFGEHSIFYVALLDESVSSNLDILKDEYKKNKQIYSEFLSFYKEKITNLNECLRNTNKEVYLFGAHLFSQFLLFNGLDYDKIVCILDNDKNKQGKRLYGTKLKIASPQILRDKNALLVLNAGAYTEEIKQDILQNINSKVEII